MKSILEFYLYSLVFKLKILTFWYLKIKFAEPQSIAGI